MRLDPDTGIITFRQSWLGNAMNCPEKGRRQVLQPEQSRTSDEAFIGTAAHAGIEAVINGECAASDIGDAVRAEYAHNPEVKQIYFARPQTHQSTIGECIDLSIRCAEAWVVGLMPVAPWEEARTEVAFDQYLFDHRGHPIHIKGTVDLAPTDDHPLWDWKTSANPYRQKDKQKGAVQPTVYCMADHLGGMGRTRPATSEFSYGVMIKRKKECKTEVVTVQRDLGHYQWLGKQLRAWVDLLLDTNASTPWPVIDDGNFLCSRTWCEYYDDCRGAAISNESDLFGYNPK
jgi:hypothetical protein